MRIPPQPRCPVLQHRIQNADNDIRAFGQLLTMSWQTSFEKCCVSTGQTLFLFFVVALSAKVGQEPHPRGKVQSRRHWKYGAATGQTLLSFFVVASAAMVGQELLSEVPRLLLNRTMAHSRVMLCDYVVAPFKSIAQY